MRILLTYFNRLSSGCSVALSRVPFREEPLYILVSMDYSNQLDPVFHWKVEEQDLFKAVWQRESPDSL
jgi:hypothetical protein